MSLRAHPLDAPARQAARQARRPDRARRVAHVRHGGPVPPARHLQPARAALHARGPRAADVLPRGQARPGAPGGHQRAGRDVLVHRRGHVVLQPRRPDDPVLHLLLDVRLPADRRPRLGRRRQPHARVHARRHRGPDDAQRRGPAARGRPLAPAERDDPELRLVRPDVQLRARRDHPRGPAPDDHRAGGRLLLPHADERELSAPGDAGGGGGGHPARDVPAAAARRGRGAGAADGLGHDPARGAGRRRTCSPTTGAWARTCGASRRFTELRREGMEDERWNMLHPGRGAADDVGRAVARFARRRPGDRGDGLHALVRGPDPAVGERALPRARHRRLRPLATTARRCARSSRWIATTSCWRR